jgi:hypothetical protein
MPPPPRPDKSAPLGMVRLAMVTVVPEPKWNTRLAALPLTAKLVTPGPRMVTLLVISSSPVVSVMVPETTVASIVSPSAAQANAPRNEPGPLSAVVVTVVLQGGGTPGPA